MYLMAHDCFYPVLGLFPAMRVTYMTLVLLKTIRFISKRKF